MCHHICWQKVGHKEWRCTNGQQTQKKLAICNYMYMYAYYCVSRWVQPIQLPSCGPSFPQTTNLRFPSLKLPKNPRHDTAPALNGRPASQWQKARYKALSWTCTNYKGNRSRTRQASYLHAHVHASLHDKPDSSGSLTLDHKTKRKKRLQRSVCACTSSAHVNVQCTLVLQNMVLGYYTHVGKMEDQCHHYSLSKIMARTLWKEIKTTSSCTRL